MTAIRTYGVFPRSPFRHRHDRKTSRPTVSTPATACSVTVSIATKNGALASVSTPMSPLTVRVRDDDADGGANVAETPKQMLFSSWGASGVILATVKF